jgi:holo-[acyl-carrier protein] synthase
MTALRAPVRTGEPDAMILGLGSDLIDIRRIEQVIERFGDRFLDRIFTDAERRKCDRRQ